MSRYRLYLPVEQAAAMEGHCGHARYVWNLAVEQQSWWNPRCGPAPSYHEQSRQLTEARRENPWLAAGSQTVQQQALRDFATAMASFFRGSHRRPSWRKRGRSAGFRIVAVKPTDVRVLNLRWSAGHRQVAFAAVPDPIPGTGTGTGTGTIVGVDRGVAVSAALSTGALLHCPGLRPGEQARLLRLQRRLARAKRGSNRRTRLKAQIGRVKAREVDRRKDWVEKTSTSLARRYDLIRVEDLRIGHMTRSARGTLAEPGRNMRQKAGLNRSILSHGWGLLVARLEQKAPGRVEKINPTWTSQTCNTCGTRDRQARESQAVFGCRACGQQANADVNAARNIALGHQWATTWVTARGGDANRRPANREPQHCTPPLPVDG
ncbi:RNA-guided endonuclease InsQ/TnpB family protein [Frankia tisae]|uniref:RNA-guided endonuclease InsQ/TnpB family protein n=1 Tax=Frankia tisae TaxID=2950104 RepID=UPI0021BE726A|nr:transposase [Frankia tisae]